MTLTDVSEPVSDHCCVHAEFRISSPVFRKGTTQEFVYRDLDKTDWPGLRAALANVPLFNAIQGTMDVNVALRVCQNLFLQPVFKFISWRTVFVRPGNKTWMTSDLFRLSRQKYRSLKAACRSQSEKA